MTTEAERKGREEPSRRNAFNFLENFSLAPLRIFGNTDDEVILISIKAFKPIYIRRIRNGSEPY